jgi:hypothetical protein
MFPALTRPALLLCVMVACGRKPAAPPPELVVVGESTRVRLEGERPATTAWFDGQRVSLVAARGEVLGLQIVSRAAAPVTLAIQGVTVEGFDVESFTVSRPSTAMYGGSQGAGTYPDVLHPSKAPSTNPAYFEVRVGREVPSATYTGELVVGTRHVPVTLFVSPEVMPAFAPSVWAYGDPRELAWATTPTGDPPRDTPSPTELACSAMAREYGVMLTPNIRLDWWPARKAGLAVMHDLPVWIPSDPAEAGDAVRGWIAATAGTGQIPFAIPIDEPSTPEKQAKVKELAAAVRAAGGGPTTFRYAVTDDIRPEVYGDLIDLYITLNAKRSDTAPRWTYQSGPPRSGSMVLDAVTPGMRTWGWIAWRWHISTWYVWDALYWHDRYNRKGAPLPGTPLVVTRDPVSFDDGQDHGNLDGVLTLPAPGGCTRTLRLAAIRRGLQDKALLDLAATCNSAQVEALAAKVVPRALGDAPIGSARSWSADESDWERARRQLLELASCATPP